MSAELLQRVAGHIVTDGGLLGAYTLRYFRWTDADLRGSGNVALFRMTGTAGQVTRQAQFLDVSLYLLSPPDRASAADADMLAVLRYLRDDYAAADVFNIVPLASYTGPTYLENGRAMFEMVLRTGSTDH
jgi:hypothetical protein